MAEEGRGGLMTDGWQRAAPGGGHVPMKGLVDGDPRGDRRDGGTYSPAGGVGMLERQELCLVMGLRLGEGGGAVERVKDWGTTD